MKKLFRVLVSETYSKWIDVAVDDDFYVDEEVRNMQEAGEIEWDRAEDFDSWDVLEKEEKKPDESEIQEVKKWADDMVRVTEIVDSDWIMEEMEELQSLDWFEQLRDRGVTIPRLATSQDLWDAVLKIREEKK